MKKITLDNLSTQSVTVKRVDLDAEGNQISSMHAVSYVNSVLRRDRINELEEPYRTAVLAIWGDVPVIDDTVASE